MRRFASILLALTAMTSPLAAQAPEDFAVRIGSVDICRMMDTWPDWYPLGFIVVDVEVDLGKAGVQGLSLAVCAEYESVAVARAAGAMPEVLEAKGGHAPDFLDVRIIPPPNGAAVLRVIVDQAGRITLPAQAAFPVLSIGYELMRKPTQPGCATVATALRPCDVPGTPPIPSAVTVGDQEIPFGGANQDGAIRAGYTPIPEDRFAVRVSDIEALRPDGEAEAEVTLDFLYCLETGTCQEGQIGAYEVQGWSLGVCHDPKVLRAVTAEPHPDLETIYFGHGPDFDVIQVYEQGVTQGLVFDFAMFAKIPAQNDVGTLIIRYDAVAPPDVGDPPKTTELEVCDGLGDVPVDGVMVVDGVSIPPDARLGGTVTLVPGPATTPFLRGDANGDSRVNIADAVWILDELFRPQAHPAHRTTCADAADANDDGRRDATDAVAVVRWIFLDGPEPPSPGPWACDEDPTEDDLDCASYPECR
ncbi:MAG: hypothetical protein JXP34_00670 [Planctomycetes bacterium]|nr:hypothetical protein [Planctomycetota bacterium]